MKIDIHSSTWKEIERFAASEREDAIALLVADRDSDKQRGALIILERLVALAGREDDQQSE